MRFSIKRKANGTSAGKQSFFYVIFWKIATTSISVLFSILLVNGQISRITKGPYLLYPGENTTMTLLWQLDTSLVCQLSWGSSVELLDGSVLTTETAAGTDEHQHIFTITNLTPGLLYYYKVTENNTDYSGSFHAAPNQTTEIIKILAIGDTRTNTHLLDSVSLAILTAITGNVNFQTLLLHLGDWNGSDAETYWTNNFFHQNYYNTRVLLSVMPINGIRGNHEDDATVFLKYWPYPYQPGGYYYSFDYGPVHVTIVDQYTDYSIGSAQYFWIENDLATTTKAWKIVLFHAPAYSDGGGHLNDVTAQLQLLPLLSQQGVKFVLNGHNHYYSHCLVDGIHHLTIGGGGAPLYIPSGTGEGLVFSESSLHYTVLGFDGTSALIETFRPDGILMESFSETVSVSGSVRIEDLKKDYSITIYPNPTSTYLTVGYASTKKVDIKVLVDDGKGITIWQKELIDFSGTKTEQIDVTGWSKGIYFVSVLNGNDRVTRQLIIF